MSILVWGSIMTAARMAIAALSAPRPFARLLEHCRAFFFHLTDSYQPEKHYMRGPGPKCRAKATAQGR